MQDDYQAQQHQRPAQHQGEQPGHEQEMTPRPIFIRDDYSGSGKLKDKVALITGGDSGIGRSVAVHYAREGANLTIVYLNEHEDARETQRLIEAEGRACHLLSGDVGDEAFCREAVAATVECFGKLDILVNHAGEQHPTAGIEEIPTEQLKRTFRTNCFSFFYMTRAAIEHMQAGSVIINTSSVTAYRGSSHLIDYAASNGAVAAFTRSLAAALAKRNIRVNGVAPGPIWTPLIPASFEAEEVKEFGANTPMGRAGQPAEVGPCYVFLASSDASYMTGQELHPNGGQFMST
ncbi:MAG: SDR family oxidoreductase [Pseudomonadota bacterium]|nr:SDR family oxidoreductase [Pseudomonadota bacterium]